MITKRKERPKLPAYVEPMLAKMGQPFDSPDYLFEIKWDGTRCLCFVDRALPAGYRLVSRRRIDMTERYPEFASLRSLPDGTILDGEVVVLREGKADFGLLQTREQAQSPLKIRTKSRAMPATFIAFDILYDRGLSVMNRRLVERKALLEELVRNADRPALVMAQGITGAGKECFRRAVDEGLEGLGGRKCQTQQFDLGFSGLSRGPAIWANRLLTSSEQPMRPPNCQRGPLTFGG